MKCHLVLYAVFVLFHAADMSCRVVSYKDLVLSCVFCYQSEVFLSFNRHPRVIPLCALSSRQLCKNDILDFLVCQSYDSQGGEQDQRGEPETSLVVRKRTAVAMNSVKKEDSELASVPWQTLWLLQSPRSACAYPDQETLDYAPRSPRDLRLAEWVRPRTQEFVGVCPVKFRPLVDPNRWLPKNMVGAECVCEGSPCARRGLHVCVTMFASRNVFSFSEGRRRILIAVGCLCALQKTRLANAIVPKTVD